MLTCLSEVRVCCSPKATSSAGVWQQAGHDTFTVARRLKSWESCENRLCLKGHVCCCCLFLHQPSARLLELANRATFLAVDSALAFVDWGFLKCK